jgi:hypothetical protein
MRPSPMLFFLLVAPSALYDWIKKSSCSTLVIMACRSYICFGREKVVYAKKKKRERK